MPKKYDQHRDDSARRSRERSESGRDIGPLPAVADPDRKARCAASLLDFARTYFPARFPWPFAKPHEEAGAMIDDCSRDGGQGAEAMPRGTGKTTLAEVAAIRNVLYGWRRFVLIVQATEKLAARSLKKIQRELESNDRLAEDFPEVCHPIRALKRINHRTRGQTLDGAPTRMEWTAEGMILPTVKGAASSGAIIYVAGITGAIRGASMSGPAGEILRPDMVLIDDAQTRESAGSSILTGDRETIVIDDVMGLAGPDVEIAVLMLCTVIYPGDLSDRFLDADRHPTWQRIRTRMIEAWPANMALWDQYWDIRRETFKTDKGRASNRFYENNRTAMDAGGSVSWPERMKPGELSGLQSAMNLHYKNPRGFRAEYQNDPEPEGGPASGKRLDPQLVAARLAGLERHQLPRESTHLTAFIDPGQGLHWYAVVAWDQWFGGSVVDYGTWPRQARAVFARDDPRPSLEVKYPGAPVTAAVFAGLKELTAELLGRTYYRDGAGEQRVELCLIDSGWETTVVYQFVRQAAFAGTMLYPSKGFGRTTTQRGVGEWKPRPGERKGFNWRLTTGETGKGKAVQFDPDPWKTFLFERLTTPPGARGWLGLWGKKEGPHELIGQHCGAEAAEPVTLRGATFDKWARQPGRDGDLYDCLVGCAVAASVLGLTWAAGADPEPKRVKVKKDPMEAYNRARGLT